MLCGTTPTRAEELYVMRINLFEVLRCASDFLLHRFYGATFDVLDGAAASADKVMVVRSVERVFKVGGAGIQIDPLYEAGLCKVCKRAVEGCLIQSIFDLGSYIL